MGNNLGGRKRVKVMKINGEILKFRDPIQACDVVKDYPDHVLLDLKAAKQLGVRAKPLEPQRQLEAGKIYFLIELPKLPVPEEEKVTRRVRSGVNMTAKDRLECLMLSRRSVSELLVARPTSLGGPGPVRVKMRLPRAQVDKLVEESRDEAEVAERIINLYRQQNTGKIAQHT